MTATDTQRILLTGATGFIGSRVALLLAKQSRDFALLMRPGAERTRIQEIMDTGQVIVGDLATPDSYREAVAGFGPSIVLHLAWGGVSGSERNDMIQLQNVQSSMSLLRLAMELECQQFVGLGSQAEYGPVSGAITESTPTYPTTAYGAAKLGVGLLIERMAAASGMRASWLRLFSSYGPNDNPDWLIPYLIRALMAGQTPALTKCEQVWDFIHVDDVARAIVAAVDSEVHGTFNIGSGTAVPLRDVAELIRDRVDPSAPLGFGEVPYRPDQVMHLEADITAFTSATHWQPMIDLESGINETVAWHQTQMAQ